MRNYIFEFEQEQALKLDLKLSELLLLDYMLKFFQCDQIKRKRRNERFYCRVTYNKVLGDLPILRIKERQLRNMLIGLENKGLVERFSELKNQMYVYVNWELLFGNELPDNENDSATDCLGVGKDLPAIDNYDNNKIKIIIDNVRVRDVDLDLFNKKFHELLKDRVSSVSYGLFLCECKAVETTESEIVFKVKWKEHLEKYFLVKFEQTVRDALRYFL